MGNIVYVVAHYPQPPPTQQSTINVSHAHEQFENRFYISMQEQYNIMRCRRKRFSSSRDVVVTWFKYTVVREYKKIIEIFMREHKKQVVQGCFLI
jgi:hypothetical protein